MKSHAVRARNLQSGQALLEELVAFDYHVMPFSEYHFRINERLDIWPSSLKWYDVKNHHRGRYRDLVKFVTLYFKKYGVQNDA